MATEAAAAKVAAMGLPKLNSYPHSKGGRGGSRGSLQGRSGGRGGGRGGFGGGGNGGAPAPGQKPQRRRTLERKLARSKGTNRMVDRESGAMMGRVAALSNAKTKLKVRLAAEGGAAVAPLTPEEIAAAAAGAPKKKKQKLAPAPVKKGSLLPNSGSAASNLENAALPDFLRALGMGAGARDSNGEAAWDLDEEMRYFEQQLGIRKAKKKKAAKAAAAAAAKVAAKEDARLGAGAGDDSDDAELDEGAMSKLRAELDEDGLGDLFDFCDLLENDGKLGSEDEDGFDRNDPDNRDEDEAAPAAATKDKKKKTSAEIVAAAAATSEADGYSAAKRARILAKEAAIDARQDAMEAALSKAMDKQARKDARAKATREAIANGTTPPPAEEESEESEEDEDMDDGEDDEDEDEDGEDEEDDKDMDADAAISSRKRRREDDDEEEGEDDEDADDGEDDEGELEDDEEEKADADEDGEEEEAPAAAAAPEKKKPSIEDLYGFNAPVPDSLLAFRRGDKNILASAPAAGGAAGTEGAKTASATGAPTAPAKYVPPHLRAQLAAAAAAAAPAASSAAAAAQAVGVSSASSLAGQAALRRQLKGLLNRLTSANIENIALQMSSTMYAQHSKREVTELLCEELLSLCTLEADASSAGYVVGSNSSTLLASAALVVFLHSTVGADIGAHFLEKFVLAFRDFSDRSAAAANGAGGAPSAHAIKACTTLVTFLTYLYNFELVGSGIVYDLIRKFVGEFRPDSIECLLVILQNCGYQLRKTDPAALKDIILLIQNKAKIYNASQKKAGVATTPAPSAAVAAGASATASAADMPEGRVGFMLDMIYDLKNNKKRHTALFDSIQPLNNWLQGKLKRKRSASGGSATPADMQLRFGYDDIVNIETRGRWWLVGSAWKGKRMGEPSPAESASSSSAAAAAAGRPAAAAGPAKVVLPAEDSAENVDLLSLARSQHMNTELRKSLFLVVMSAVDYLDAYEKLCKLSLAPSQLRQVVKVLFDCAANEAKWNPYYAFVLLQLARMDGGKEIKFTAQLALWDLVKEWELEAQMKEMRSKGARTEDARAAMQVAKQRQVLHVAKMVSVLLREPVTGSGGIGAGGGGGLGLSALKAFDFHALSPLQLLFLTAALKDFMLLSEPAHIRGSMLRLHGQMNDKKATVARNQEAKLLRDGLDFFLQHHLLPTATALKNKEQAKLLTQRITQARKAMAGEVDSDWMFNK